SVSSSEAIGKLKETCSGLQFMSESDYPFEVFAWEGQAGASLTPEKLAQATGHPADAPVKVITLSDFFRSSTEEQDWFGPEEKESAAKFKNLENTIASTLNDVKVYRVGQIEIDVYIIGTCGNDCVGLSTKVIET
ncbi:nuclease A inhibitor family protein, partial [Trichocoleus desertorum AS-A10]|uniref:nuclease A inhibitor family protein n=1 Tax=Trichocoleus desertorum TaxID=1481672 RepID=UPI003296CD2D